MISSARYPLNQPIWKENSKMDVDRRKPSMVLLWWWCSQCSMTTCWMVIHRWRCSWNGEEMMIAWDSRLWLPRESVPMEDEAVWYWLANRSRFDPSSLWVSLSLAKASVLQQSDCWSIGLLLLFNVWKNRLLVSFAAVRFIHLPWNYFRARRYCSVHAVQRSAVLRQFHLALLLLALVRRFLKHRHSSLTNYPRSSNESHRLGEYEMILFLFIFASYPLPQSAVVEANRTDWIYLGHPHETVFAPPLAGQVRVAQSPSEDSAAYS